VSGTWDRVHEVLHELLELPAVERARRLDALARTDELLAREVRSLLDAHEASEGFLDESPGLPPVSGAEAGERIGPYRVLGPIGHGGMGVVVRARRADGHYTQDVAIKLIDPALRSEAVLRRFRDERQILAMLEHPHIARLLDGGTTPEGAPYLVMELIEGRTLLADCDARRLDIAARLALFLQICDAVQFAHQRLVVHRDLKSDNILVAPDGTPRLLDFGVAKLLAADSEGDAATLTAPMHRMLTPDYASPEQIRGEPASVAGDVYSLGVVLYELLVAQRPLRFTTRSPEEVLHVALTAEARPPSAALGDAAAEVFDCRAATPRSLRRELTGDLDFITLKALEKDPARRYGTVEQLSRDLRRYTSGRPVLARGQSTTYRVSRFVRRNRVAVFTTALVVLALVAGLIGTTWQAALARRERDRSQRRFEDVRALAHAVVFDLHDAIISLPGSTPARELLVRHALRYLDGLRADAGDDAAIQYELAMAYAKIADVQGRPMFPNLGQSAAALQSYDRALALLDRVMIAWPDSSRVSRDRFVTQTRRSDLLGAMGRDAEALATMEDAKQRANLALASQPGDTQLIVDLAVICDRLFDQRLAAGDTAGAMREFDQGLALMMPKFLEDPRDAGARRGLLIRHAKRGSVHAARGERDSALASYAAAETLALAATAALPHDTDARRDLSIVYGMHGLFLAEVGSLDAALEVYGRGMRIAEQLAQEDPSNALSQYDVATGHLELGGMLLSGGRAVAALARYSDAFARFVQLSASDTANADHRDGAMQSAAGAARACGRVGRTVDAARWREQAARYAPPGSAPDSSR